MRELEGDIGQAVADVRDALHREVAALAQAEDERSVRHVQGSGCTLGLRLHLEVTATARAEDERAVPCCCCAARRSAANGVLPACLFGSVTCGVKAQQPRCMHLHCQ